MRLSVSPFYHLQNGTADGTALTGRSRGFRVPCAAGLAQSEATRPEGYRVLSFFPSRSPLHPLSRSTTFLERDANLAMAVSLLPLAPLRQTRPCFLEPSGGSWSTGKPASSGFDFSFFFLAFLFYLNDPSSCGTQAPPGTLSRGYSGSKGSALRLHLSG